MFAQGRTRSNSPNKHALFAECSPFISGMVLFGRVSVVQQDPEHSCTAGRILPQLCILRVRCEQTIHGPLTANLLWCCSIYDEFVKKAAERAQNRKVGDPFSSETEQGPQVISLYTSLGYGLALASHACHSVAQCELPEDCNVFCAGVPGAV